MRARFERILSSDFSLIPAISRCHSYHGKPNGSVNLSGAHHTLSLCTLAAAAVWHSSRPAVCCTAARCSAPLTAACLVDSATRPRRCPKGRLWTLNSIPLVCCQNIRGKICVCFSLLLFFKKSKSRMTSKSDKLKSS
jgi:hypothetical protein